jgi:hypothetical protein
MKITVKLKPPSIDLASPACSEYEQQRDKSALNEWKQKAKLQQGGIMHRRNDQAVGGCKWVLVGVAALGLGAIQSNAQNVNTPGGAKNYVAKFSGSNTIVDSRIVDNGSTVSINGPIPIVGAPPAPPLVQLSTIAGPGMTATAGAIHRCVGHNDHQLRRTWRVATGANGTGVVGWDHLREPVCWLVRRGKLRRYSKEISMCSAVCRNPVGRSKSITRSTLQTNTCPTFR